MDERTEIRRAVDTGKVSFGYRQVEKSVLRGEGKLVVVTKNLAGKKAEKLKHVSGISGVNFYNFDGTSLQLGAVCGKPFAVSALLVIDEGKSKVLELSSKKKTEEQ